MARNSDLPKPESFVLYKSKILKQLQELDNNSEAKQRVLAMETGFRQSMQTHINSLPEKDAKFRKFNTSPFVLLIHCFKRGYSKISQIEEDILPAKEFSSMETSAGRMTEVITFPIYEWGIVSSSMHSMNSALDGMKMEGEVIKLATLKSGPRCLNDEMSENFADAIIQNASAWAKNNNVKEIDFTYGVLYGTKKQSNKKDWHILRNLMEKLPEESFEVLPKNRWDCVFTLNDTKVRVAIRIGYDWWQYLGGQYGLLELVVALIRATISPNEEDPDDYEYIISDIKNIISTKKVPTDFNVSILQKSQLKWLFFMLYHYCDSLQE